MAGNTENIEAKLAAYIDGDLDAQGRAEIEKHLVANPQHRTLIEQLSRQRELLRELPREEAPEDILEALQSQMERSVLLGDDDAGEPSEHMKIHRWPQVFAAAAIVLLTVGLGAIIYFVLPRGNGTGDYAVVATQRGASLEDGMASTAPASPSPSMTPDPRHDGDVLAGGPLPSKTAAKSAVADEAMLKREAGTETAVAADNAVAMKKGDVFSAQGFGGGGAGAVAMEDLLAARQLSQNADIARRLKDSPVGLADNPVFVVVNAADPSAARSQVTQYLESNKIAWEPVSQPMPGPLNIGETQTVHMDRVQRSQVQVKLGERRATDAKSGVALQEVDKSNATADTNTAAAANAPAAPAAASPLRPAEGEEQVALEQQQQQRRTEPAPAQHQRAVQAPAGVADAARSVGQSAPSNGTISNAFPPDAALAEVKEAQEKATQAPAEDQARQQQQPPLQQQVAQQPQQESLHMRQSVAQPGSEARLIVARGMTRQQAEELSSNLSKQMIVQRAAVYETRVGADAQMKDFARANASAAPSTQPAQVGGNLAGQPGAAGAAALPTTVPAAGLAERSGGQANKSPTTSPSGEGSTTQPVDQLGMFGAVPAATPATQPSSVQQSAPQQPAPLSSFEAAATQSTTAALEEERVDVVILLSDDAPPIAPAEQQQQQAEQHHFDATPQPVVPAAPAPTATTAPTTQSIPATQPGP